VERERREIVERESEMDEMWRERREIVERESGRGMHRGGRERGVREGEETTQERERQEGEEENEEKEKKISERRNHPLQRRVLIAAIVQGLQEKE